MYFSKIATFHLTLFESITVELNGFPRYVLAHSANSGRYRCNGHGTYYRAGPYSEAGMDTA